MDDRATTEAGCPRCRLYADENYSFPVVQQLRKHGYDVLTVQEAGKAGQRIPDELVLSFAHADRRAVITSNRRHFIQLHRQSAEHSGIVVCTVDPDHIALATRIAGALDGIESLAKQLIRVNRPPG